MFYRLSLYTSDLDKADEDSLAFQEAHGGDIASCGLIGAGQGEAYIAVIEADSRDKLPTKFNSLEVMTIEPNKSQFLLSAGEQAGYRTRIKELLAGRVQARE